MLQTLELIRFKTNLSPPPHVVFFLASTRTRNSNPRAPHHQHFCFRRVPAAFRRSLAPAIFFPRWLPPPRTLHRRLWTAASSRPFFSLVSGKLSDTSVLLRYLGPDGTYGTICMHLTSMLGPWQPPLGFGWLEILFPANLTATGRHGQGGSGR